MAQLFSLGHIALMHRFLTSRIEIPWKRIFLFVSTGLITGLVVGVLMIATAILFEHLQIRQGYVNRVFEFINEPAAILTDWWARSDLPPREAGATGVIVMFMLVGQWTIIGMFIGFCVFFVKRGKSINHVA